LTLLFSPECQFTPAQLIRAASIVHPLADFVSRFGDQRIGYLEEKSKKTVILCQPVVAQAPANART
jgi:hypothetical protein